MDPTKILEHEHEVILLVLDAAERESEKIAKSGTVNKARIYKFVDFFRNFADRCHHAKEEKHLFVMMEERGIPRQGGPIGVMLLEHEQGRRHVSAIAEALSAVEDDKREAATTIAENLMAYVRLLRAHIDKENIILYPLGLQVLTEDDLKLLSESFDKVEAEEMGDGVHEKFHWLAHELAES